ncbi:MurR/RpiR family transcriptional regulator [Amycolatopsis sp. FDAARGOS 1241]|uniref:MurR/RpiR family transcriptional regulator n=1 Tax=Amycolatopsis sp. FDAARGOS 1241 TaxID=2778070 RepID=UPI00194F5E6E|nr:MurR/RpiR family transcriptional regulator [Amycolatopsis sp. FDAARGOS 1241]QRP43291.1 MurR/RpiR family transcriptional regulator [Amycolatopsis sp. FDAARGOS 1241]
MTARDEKADPLSARVAERFAELSPAEQRVADYLMRHQQAILLSTAGDLGTLSGTSDATVVRAVKALGYSGLPELKREVGKQVVGDTNPATRLRERIEQAGGDPAALLDQVLTESVERLTETRRLLTTPEFAAAVDLLDDAEEVLGYGLGPSELPMQYLVTRLHRLGRRAWSTSATGFRLADDLVRLTAGDLVVLNVPDRVLHDIKTLVEHAREIGARVLLITNSTRPALAGRVDVTLTAVQSLSGLSHDGLGASLVVDCLLAGLARKDPAAVSQRTDLLVALRTALVPRDLRPRRPGRP